MRLVYFLVVCFVMMPTSAARADPACMKNAKTEEAINICQHAEATRLELQVKELEEKIRARFKDAQLERFNIAQEAWQQMTEKDCEVEADFYEGAPVYPAIAAQCLQNHYEDRIRILTNYLCPEYSFVKGCAKP